MFENIIMPEFVVSFGLEVDIPGQIGEDLQETVYRMYTMFADGDYSSMPEIREVCEPVISQITEQAKKGLLSKVDVAHRQAFAAASMIKALADLTEESCSFESLEKALRMLDKAYLLGLPLPGWNLPRILNVVKEQIHKQRAWNKEYDMRRLTKRFPKQQDPSLIITHVPYMGHAIDHVFREDCPPVEVVQYVLMAGEALKIENAMKRWSALVKWQYLAYLNRTIGMRTVPIEMGDYSRGGGLRLTTVSEYLEELVNGRTTDECGYLAQHQIFDQEPVLLQDIIVPEYCNVTNYDITMNIWLGPAHTVTPLHFDPQPGLLCQIFGRKLVTLYSAENSDYLYPRDGMRNHSQVDFKRPDLSKFPLFKKAVPKYCLLHPGEMLLIPEGYWHCVESLDVSCSVNFHF